MKRIDFLTAKMNARMNVDMARMKIIMEMSDEQQRPLGSMVSAVPGGDVQPPPQPTGETAGGAGVVPATVAPPAPAGAE